MYPLNLFSFNSIYFVKAPRVSVTLQNHRRSQEIVRSSFLGRYSSSFLWCSFEYLVKLGQIFVKFQDGSHITAPVTVIGRRPDSNESVVEHLLVSFHDELMCSADEVYVIFSVKLVYDFAAEQVASTTWTDHPSWNVVGVGPHQVAHGAVVGNFLLPVNHADLVKGADGR